MIPLCPSPTVGSECITCGIYTVAADKPQLITGNFSKVARGQSCTKSSNNMLPRLTRPGSTPAPSPFIDSAKVAHKHTPSPRCGGITGGMTHLSESFKGFFFFFFFPSHLDNPFLSVMLQYRFLTAPRITGERTVVGAMMLVVWWCGGVGGGGFHSDTKAMKRLDQRSVQWVPVPVCVWV